MRIIFSVRNFWYLKFFDRAIRELVERGHHVHVTAERERHWKVARERLAREHPGISFSGTPRVATIWLDLSLALRRTIDFVRFLTPAFSKAPVLLQRAETRAPAIVRRCMRWPVLRNPHVARVVERALTGVEGALPTNAALRQFLQRERPDVLVITPLIALGSTQFDILQAAQELGIPTALAVGSWDHLSSKTLLRICPDMLLVWNDMQRSEAETFHGVPSARVVVTGAQCFDHWFERHPAMDRSTFSCLVNLPAHRPYVLYVCSALFEGSPSEALFVARWVASLRESTDPVLRDVPVLIRPHPKRAYEFDGLELDRFENVALWPRDGEVPITDEAQNVYFDSIFHSAAVVGLNTSAMIEAGIIGRSVHTVMLPEFYDNQEGTLHFRHLLEAGGGLLHASRSLSEHKAQLRAVLADGSPLSLNHRFVETFVRPHGLDHPATPIFVDAIERLASQRGVPTWPRSWARGVRALLWPLAWLLRETGDTEKIWRQTRQSERSVTSAAQKAARKVAQVNRMTMHRERKRAADQRRKRLGRWSTEIRSRCRNLFHKAS
jgi:hypothetical protein